SGVGNRHCCRVWGACNLQEKLVLLRLQSGFQCRSFTEMQEAAQLKAEVRQGANEGIGNKGFRVSGHIYIVSRYKCL
ncbi:MAG: hypothetical protein WBV33_08085, partial [Terracidiphilus sp.]